MKKIIIILILIISFSFQASYVNAWDTVTIRTTEKVPWVNCQPVPKKDWMPWEVYPNLYDCEVEKWVWQIVSMLWQIIKYFTYIALLSWVLFIVYNWILYSMWWADQSLKDDSKKRIIWTLIWLILLLLSWPILQLIAPWIYK